MCSKAPVRTGIKTSAGECALYAKLCFASLNILNDLLQRSKVFDVVSLIASLLKQLLVVDNAVVFLYIINTVDNAILLKLKSIISELIQNLGALKVNAVIFYANKTRRSICLEQCWSYRGVLVNLRLECLCIGIRSSSYYLYRNLCFLSILSCKIFPLLISLRLEVQEIN